MSRKGREKNEEVGVSWPLYTLSMEHDKMAGTGKMVKACHCCSSRLLYQYYHTPLLILLLLIII